MKAFLVGSGILGICAFFALVGVKLILSAASEPGTQFPLSYFGGLLFVLSIFGATMVIAVWLMLFSRDL